MLGSKPEEIRIAGKGTIKIVYDASGTKLLRTFTAEGSANTRVTTYINEFVYEETVPVGTPIPPSGGGGALQYINFEEGRIRVMQAVSQNNGYDILTLDGNIDLPGNKRGAFDFFVRDYQSNVRMILTQETHFGSNSCTMEQNRAANEEPIFGQVDNNGNPTAANEVAARFPVANIPGQGSGNGWTDNTIGSYVSRVGNLAQSKIGPNTLLKVMAGDKVSASTMYYYQNPVMNNPSGNTLLSALLNSLLSAISGSGVTGPLVKDGAAGIGSQLSGSIPFSNATSPPPGPTFGYPPKAYLTILFFDERFKFIEEGSTLKRVLGPGSGQAPLVLDNIKAPKNGYCFVYVSNEADEMVYFDNLQVAHNRGHIVEENHYYAYGLKITGISSKKLGDVNEGKLKNEYLYNDKELFDDADLNWYDYGFRNYDAQIGRFVQIDPLAAEYDYQTPYAYAGNDPITNIDFMGLGVETGLTAATAKVIEGVTVTATRTAVTSGISVAGGLLRLGSSTISQALKLTLNVGSHGWPFFSDIFAGVIYGAVDNILGTSLRATYRPIDPDTYNNALRATDEAMVAGGTAMMVHSTSTIETGVLALAGGPEAGGPIIIAGVAELAVGYLIASNASANIAKGYNYGREDDPITVKEEDKIPRDQLDPPKKEGGAPTFKKDGKPVELHHNEQNPNGPFKEMHPNDHRGKGNDLKNHPNKFKKSNIDRKNFNKQRKQYWKKEYPKLPSPTFQPTPKG